MSATHQIIIHGDNGGGVFTNGNTGHFYVEVMGAQSQVYGVAA